MTGAAEPPADSAPPAVRLTTPHAREMLQKRYCAPEWALLEEVAPATGGGTTYADAVAVNLWASRGHAIHGFEIKVSRSDWLRELKQPAKAEGVYNYCDHWWILAPAGIVKDGELPPTWGLLELRANGIAQKVNAPRLEPKPVNRAFFASLTRRAGEELERHAERLMRDKARDLDARHAQRVKEQVEYQTREARRAMDNIAEIKKETGLDFSDWNYHGSIATIRLAQRLEALRGHGNGVLGRLTDLLNGLDQSAAVLRAALEPITTTPPETTE